MEECLLGPKFKLQYSLQEQEKEINRNQSEQRETGFVLAEAIQLDGLGSPMLPRVTFT